MKIAIELDEEIVEKALKLMPASLFTMFGEDHPVGQIIRAVRLAWAKHVAARTKEQIEKKGTT